MGHLKTEKPTRDFWGENLKQSLENLWKSLEHCHDSTIPLLASFGSKNEKVLHSSTMFTYKFHTRTTWWAPKCPVPPNIGHFLRSEILVLQNHVFGCCILVFSWGWHSLTRQWEHKPGVWMESDRSMWYHNQSGVRGTSGMPPTNWLVNRCLCIIQASLKLGLMGQWIPDRHGTNRWSTSSSA